MPKCKMSICQAEAVPGAPKRYCSWHLSEYLRKQREYAAIQRTLRCCEVCGGKLTKTSHDRGDTRCRDCQAEADAAAAENARYRAEQDAKRARLLELSNCLTIDDLKRFIINHLLERN